MSGLSGDALIEKAETIQSKMDFAAFMQLLLQNYREYPDEWENNTLELFLEGLASFIENVEEYYSNIGIEIHLDRPSWRALADFLLAARVYE